MRVVQATSFHYRRGGDSIQCLELSDALRQSGHDVAAFSMNHPDNVASPWQRYWVDHVEYRGDLTAIDRLRAAWRSVYHVESGRKMGRLLRDFAPDVVHFHSVHHHLTMAAVEACEKARVPIVWTLHDYRTVCPATSLLRGDEVCERCAGGRFWHCVAGRCKSGELSRGVAATVESYVSRWRRSLERVDCYVAPSRFLAETVLRMGLPARRIEVVPNPIWGPPATDRPARRGDDLLFVGRLSPEKGVDTLVRAVSRLDDAVLRVVGDGPERERLEALAHETRAKVVFDGWLDTQQVAGRMRSAALLCVPSVWYENCPGVVLEAMAAGLPVVASDLGGLTELLEWGKAGWLVAPGDVDAWVEALREALAHPDESMRRAERALSRVRERHDPESFVRNVELIYRSLTT